MRELFEARRRGEPDQPRLGRNPPIAGVVLQCDLVSSPADVGNLSGEIWEDGFEPLTFQAAEERFAAVPSVGDVQRAGSILEDRGDSDGRRRIQYRR